MNSFIIEGLLEAIAELQREILTIDPSKQQRAKLDEAYNALARAQAALSALIG